MYVAQRGNVFMREIAGWIVAALGDLGHTAELLTDGVPVAEQDRVNLVVAPHEYFELAITDPVQRAAGAAASIPICTEQPGTAWFEIQLASVVRSPLVLDINAVGADALARRGIPAQHLPLGYHESFDRWHGAADAHRPIDVLFLGSLTERRQAVLASMASALQTMRCRFLLFEPSKPALAGDPGFVTDQAKQDLLASSKVLLNIHRNEVPYFESVRVLEAVANGAVVLTEPSLDLTPFRAVDHIVTAPLETLAATCRVLVSDPQWCSEVRTAAYEHLRSTHLLSDAIAARSRQSRRRRNRHPDAAGRCTLDPETGSPFARWRRYRAPLRRVPLRSIPHRTPSSRSCSSPRCSFVDASTRSSASFATVPPASMR